MHQLLAAIGPTKIGARGEPDFLLQRSDRCVAVEVRTSWDLAQAPLRWIVERLLSVAPADVAELWIVSAQPLDGLDLPAIGDGVQLRTLSLQDLRELAGRAATAAAAQGASYSALKSSA